MAKQCTVCGDKLADGPMQIIFRTSKPECYIFDGGPNDERTGIKFHARHGITDEPTSNEIVVNLNASDATLVYKYGRKDG